MINFKNSKIQLGRFKLDIDEEIKFITEIKKTLENIAVINNKMKEKENIYKEAIYKLKNKNINLFTNQLITSCNNNKTIKILIKELNLLMKITKLRILNIEKCKEEYKLNGYLYDDKTRKIIIIEIPKFDKNNFEISKIFWLTLNKFINNLN
jgi:hypothetical protein